MPKTRKKDQIKQRSQESVDAPKLTIKEQLAQKREKTKVRQAFIQYTASVVAGAGTGLLTGDELKPLCRQ
ncbi:MAG: hypothetical protein O2890_15445 [Cyanobacteria bacterium]|nr:hypothetical protein [Cyanobacteriota bacterium]MDA0867764.1 hypothetical protein [Cyanobacteriota bacterium]